MGIFGWLIVGVVAGAVAKALHSGQEPEGVLGTLTVGVVGVVGALLGGVIASALRIGATGSFFSFGTWLIAILGALLLLGLYGAVAGRAGRSPRGGS
jgi:uncharacterized membrane protein YeaQ/YmgE (transglycosylase-associated protein family)